MFLILENVLDCAWEAAKYSSLQDDSPMCPDSWSACMSGGLEWREEHRGQGHSLA